MRVKMLLNLLMLSQLYLTYPDRILHEARGKSSIVNFNENLCWTHYRVLMRESRDDVRNFYELEAAKNHWSTPQLERQMTSFLFERLAASKDEKHRKLLVTLSVVSILTSVAYF